MNVFDIMQGVSINIFVKTGKKKINDLGTTVILTTHNKGVIDSIGKRVITLENGKVFRDDKSGRYIL